MKLDEALFEPTTKLYFSTDREFVPPFELGEEGLHFEEDYDTLLTVVKGLRADKKYRYSINLLATLKPLYIDEDILFWSGPNLAELFLCKLDNLPYPAAFENQEDLIPSLTHINISEDDRTFLEKLKTKEATAETFSEAMQFIYMKGYNCISYLIYEGDRINDRAILLDGDAPFDYTSIEKL